MTSDEAKKEALRAAFEILRNHGFMPDPRDFPDEGDRRMIDQEFSKVMDGMEDRYLRVGRKIRRRLAS